MPEYAVRKSLLTRELYVDPDRVVREPWKIDSWVWTGTDDDEVQKTRFGAAATTCRAAS